jgi:hypothetical protein
VDINLVLQFPFTLSGVSFFLISTFIPTKYITVTFYSHFKGLFTPIVVLSEVLSYASLISMDNLLCLDSVRDVQDGCSMVDTPC